jgi:hypothetical protein
MLRDEKGFCLYFNWRTNELEILNKEDYAKELYFINFNKFVLRKQMYIKRNNNQYLKLMSYGHSNRDKYLFGINPLSLSYDVILFDYVFLF